MMVAAQLDSVYINVPDLKIALDLLHARLGLKPMLQFELVDGEHVTPIALIPIGDHTLEVLGRIADERPAAGVIHYVEIELPIAERVCLDLAAGCELIAHPASKPDLRAIGICTSKLEADQARLAQLLGEAQPQQGNLSRFDQVNIEWRTVDQPASSDVPGLAFAGWHRLSFKVASLQAAYHDLVERGWCTAVKPCRVLPGLSEAMFYLPSGLLIQITEEHVGTMLPVLAWNWVKSRFTRKPIQFHVH